MPERTADLPDELITKAISAAAGEVPHGLSGTRILQAFAVDDNVVQEHLLNTGGNRMGRWGAETFYAGDEWYARIGPRNVAVHLVDYECYVTIDRSE